MTLRSRAGSDLDRGADPIAHLSDFVRLVRLRRLRRNERRRQLRAVDCFAGRERGSRFDRVDAHDRPAQSRFVGADARGEVSERRLGAELATKLLARRLQLAPDAPHAAGPGVTTQRVDHRPTHAALGERLELDPA